MNNLSFSSRFYQRYHLYDHKVFKIELGEDEEVQIQFDDLESVQHLFESGQLTVESDEQTIIVQSSVSNLGIHCACVPILSAHSKGLLALFMFLL